MNWRDLLEKYTEGEDALFHGAFVSRWDAGISDIDTDNKRAAAEFHVQLISRIATQRLGYLDGDEVSALDSVYSLFEHARLICTKYPAAVDFSAVVWEVLNRHVRPFTARWHPVSKRGQLNALDMTDDFRLELEVVQPKLGKLATLLADVAGGIPAPTTAQEVDARSDSIVSEMSQNLKCGIPLVHGGVSADDAYKINDTEWKAIIQRRVHYDLPPTKTHAVALALSGGGIRSATFSLGVLVALARRGLMPQFDYLSTVSGGGYLGSFLTSILNSPGAIPTGEPIGMRSTEVPFDAAKGESLPIRHLRHFSKYLAAGSLASRMRMAAAQMYGMFLNALGVVLVALLLAILERVVRELPLNYEWSTAFGVACIVAGIWCVFAVFLLRQGRRAQKITDTITLLVFLLVLAIAASRGLAACHDWSARSYGPSWLSNATIICGSGAALLALTSAGSAIWSRTFGRVSRVLEGLSMGAVPLFVIGLYLVVYATLLSQEKWWPVLLGAAALSAVNIWVLNVNFTSPHRHYRNKLADAYLVQYPDPPGVNTELAQGVALKLSQTISPRAPYQLMNAALNVPASKNPRMQGRLTDFFLFSRSFCGSPLTGYAETTKWEDSDSHLDLGTAMAISGAAAAPQMGLGTKKRLSFWLALLNIRLGYWLRNPLASRTKVGADSGLFHLLQEMTGAINEDGPSLYLSDGGHIENLGVYELLRRRCKYIVAVDGEQDGRMTFAALTNLQRLASIDLGVKIDIDLDDLRLNKDGVSRSHFRFCRIEYPGKQFGYLLYVKLSLTGNEGEFLRRYRLDEPVFPHHSTADQFFTESQFEAYRSLGEHIGEKLFLRTLVGELSTKKEFEIESWFEELGKRLLQPLRSDAQT